MLTPDSHFADAQPDGLTPDLSDGLWESADEMAVSEKSAEMVVRTLAPVLTSSLLSQAVIRWVDGVQSAAIAPLPVKGLDAMQRLLDVLEEVRSPSGGWAADVPQTPENLLPYVTEEAFDLLEALQPGSEPSLEMGDVASTIASWQPDHSLMTDYCLMTEFAPWVLWAIARSTYEVMQLMEGIPVQWADSDQTWQPGVLRLAIALQFHNSDYSWAYDLVTHQLQPTLLDSAQRLQRRDPPVESPASTNEILVRDWLQQVTQQIQLATPALYPFLTGVATEWLIPHDQWRSGMAQIKLGFEFTATTEGGDRPNLDSFAAETTSLEPSSCAAIEEFDVLHSRIQFTDPNWSKNYWAIVNRQHLRATLTRLQMTELDGEMSLSPTTSALDLVRVADITAQQLRQSSALVSCNIPHQIWTMSGLNRRLLWCVSRGANGVMQLMGGIPARVLQPLQGWQSGTLRLSVTLAIQTPELEWRLDLVTGQRSHAQIAALSDEAIVRSLQDTPKGSLQTQGCLLPTVVKSLMSQVMQQIQQATPEIQLLLSGTDINLQLANEMWQPGTLKLDTQLEFMADRVG